MAGKYLLSTLGCKVNQYESQQIRDLVESLGFTPALPGEAADIAVVNTCAVTADAVSKSRSAVRRITRDEKTDVFVVGCGASADGERLGKLRGVAAVLGHDADICAELRKLLQARLNAPSEGPAAAAAWPHSRGIPREIGGDNGWIKPGRAGAAKSASTSTAVELPGDHARSLPLAVQIAKGGAAASAQLARNPVSPQAIISRPLPVVKTPVALLGRIDSFAGHQRAFLKVQDGCDAHCTYCIIPRLRPQLRFKPIDVAVEEARAMVASGHKEIILTGIFLGAFGRDTAIRRRFAKGRSPLAELVETLAKVEGLQRLRLSSLEPGDVDESFLEVLAGNPVCVPHLHLPLQSGSADIVRRMNRQYQVDDFVRMIDRVRAALDEPAITTDIIVGFPGESDRDFDQTRDLARYAGFCKIHAFPFSPREGTAAARWKKEFVRSHVVKQRMRALAELERELSLSYRSRLLGRTERVIVEPGVSSLCQCAPVALATCHAEHSEASPAPETLQVPEILRAVDLPRRARNDEPRGIDLALYHGRCDRYCMIHFESDAKLRAGNLVHVRIDRITPERTHATLLHPRGNSLHLPQLPAIG